MIYLSVEEVTALHDYYVKTFGGTLGVRDDNLLESAVFRCQASFGGEDLYRTIFDKAATLLHSLIFDHPFVDGNERAAIFSAMRFLYINNWLLSFTLDEGIAFPLFVEAKRPDISEIAQWFKDHSSKRKPRKRK